MNETATTILVVDSDDCARRSLADQLAADRYEVFQAASADAASRLLNAREFDLAIIEPALSGGGGLELLTLVRRSDGLLTRIDADLPLLALSSRCLESDRVRCLERGADDFVAKPYSYAELHARIDALLRRCERAAHPSRVRVGPLELDPLSRQAWLHACPLELSSKEFSLLRTLASDPRRVFAREELMELVWGFSEPALLRRTRTLDSHASRLRRKLAAHGARFVINVWGVGYRLTDPVAPAAVTPAGS
jgi:DNA-binding response OmpR family regulator